MIKLFRRNLPGKITDTLRRRSQGYNKARSVPPRLRSRIILTSDGRKGRELKK